MLFLYKASLNLQKERSEKSQNLRRKGLEALVVTGKSRRETSKRTTKTEVFGQSVYMFGG